MLKKVVLPETITAINEASFRACSSLVTFICLATIPPALDTSAFSSTPISSKTGTIYVPDESVEDYKAATNWVQYQSIIKPLSEYVES